MSMVQRKQSTATEASAAAMIAFKAAWADSVITPNEACEITELLEECYETNEEQDCLEALFDQARRIGSDAPNKPLGQRLTRTLRLLEGHKKGSTICDETDEPEAAA